MLTSNNQETSEVLLSGLISTIQALRLKGLNDEEIIDLANKDNLCNVMYQMYNEKPRIRTGSQEIRRMLEKNNIDNIEKKLNWIM